MIDPSANKLYDLERFEYYWLNGRVVERINRRRSASVKFPGLYYPKDYLIATIRRMQSSNIVVWGPQDAPERTAEAMLRYSRYFCDPESTDIGTEIPRSLLQTVVEHVSDATERVTKQWESTGNEEGQSGYFAGAINEVEKFQDGEWEATIRLQVFSPQIKEPLVGADMGIIVDLRNGAQRVVKATLVQAKRTEGLPASLIKLPDLRDQLEKMHETTDESYGLIFSNKGTFFVHDINPRKNISVRRFFEDKFVCRRGDRRHQTVAQAYDRSAVIDVTVARGVQI